MDFKMKKIKKNFWKERKSENMAKNKIIKQNRIRKNKISSEARKKKLLKKKQNYLRRQKE